ncbi:hypothetical protein BpHYR1_032609 [Brachionus plicatilis]|uniref:Uncharacterized protein n=1 Tax=Brachionus plicatilis TaxID=10195 RepID=A0A3M7QZS9_BRAPC|nr:hypothetical protein BpHYR1_032609 [Brachionus plicatilis]
MSNFPSNFSPNSNESQINSMFFIVFFLLHLTYATTVVLAKTKWSIPEKEWNGTDGTGMFFYGMRLHSIPFRERTISF